MPSPASSVSGAVFPVSAESDDVEQCILDWSSDLAQAEDNLRHAFFITVMGNRPTISKEEVMTELMHRFNLDAVSSYYHLRRRQRITC